MTEPRSTEPRTAEQVTRELEHERTKLVAAVANVRTDVRNAVVRQIPRVRVAGVVAVVLLAARAVVRHRRRGTKGLAEVYRVGRYALVQHDD